MKTLEFTLVSACALKCRFCPQDVLAENYSSAKRFDVDGVLAVLKKLPKDCRVDFSGFAEPFLNPLAGTFIGMAKRMEFEVHVYSTLIGLHLSTIPQLKETPPDYFRVHVPDPTGLRVNEEQWMTLHALFLETGIQATYMAMSRPSETISRYLAERRIKVELPQMLSRAGNLWRPNVGGKFKGCSMDRWHSNVIMPDGSVYGCCMDYGLSVPLGNLFAQEYGEIHEAAEKWKRAKHDTDICSNCEWAIYG